MAPPDLRRPFKRAAVSDQQRRREAALLRQSQSRADSQSRARRLASSLLLSSQINLEPPQNHSSDTDYHTNEIESSSTDIELVEAQQQHQNEQEVEVDLDAVKAARMRGPDARRWFARQLMLPEWMIDVPPNLDLDWFVFARPSGKRCFVVSSNGSTTSRLRNGSVLHRFPSSLPCGARTKEVSGPSNSYCILDCIFHEADQTYYVIDMVCWRGYSLYDCSAEFRFFWLNSKLGETGACNSPSLYHKYKFSPVPIYNADQAGLQEAYVGSVPYVKDGLLFFNKHAHYQTGSTPLVLVWKDDRCSKYVLDTDNKGEIPSEQQVVLELQREGKLSTSDDPPILLGSVNQEFLNKSGVRGGNLLRFSIKDESVRLIDGKLEVNCMDYIGKANRGRAFADSYSKVMFQYIARHSPLKFEDLVGSIRPSNMDGRQTTDINMIG